MKPRVAEWILSQVLPPGRTASMVGDWLEDAEKRGNIWFWSCVFRTAIAGLWDDFAGNPATTVGIGLIGFARCVLVPFGIILFTDTAFGITSSSHWQFALTFYLLQAWWYFQTGCWISRRSRGHELAGCVAVSLVGWAALPLELHLSHIQSASSSYLLLVGLAHDLTLLTGALSMRHRQLHPVG